MNQDNSSLFKNTILFLCQNTDASQIHKYIVVVVNWKINQNEEKNLSKSSLSNNQLFW